MREAFVIVYKIGDKIKHSSMMTEKECNTLVIAGTGAIGVVSAVEYLTFYNIRNNAAVAARGGSAVGTNAVEPFNPIAWVCSLFSWSSAAPVAPVAPVVLDTDPADNEADSAAAPKSAVAAVIAAAATSTQVWRNRWIPSEALEQSATAVSNPHAPAVVFDDASAYAAAVKSGLVDMLDEFSIRMEPRQSMPRAGAAAHVEPYDNLDWF